MRTDFVNGGATRLYANWTRCVAKARDTNDANVAERCIVYGYGALRLNPSDAAENAWAGARTLTADIIAPAQNEMLDIMGIPAGPRRAPLDRYRRWVSDGGADDDGGRRNAGRGRGNGYDPERATAPDGAANRGIAQYGGYVPERAVDPDQGRMPRSGGIVRSDGPVDLAGAADGQYPAAALDRPEIAAAVRRLVGPAVFAHLKSFSAGGPMRSIGEYTVGVACPPHACGASEARFVFSTDDVWIELIDGRRMAVYGGPSRQVRVLLSRAGGRTAWRGPVEDMGAAAASPPLVRISINPPREPRTLPPDPYQRFQPVAADPYQRFQPVAAADPALPAGRGRSIPALPAGRGRSIPALPAGRGRPLSALSHRGSVDPDPRIPGPLPPRPRHPTAGTTDKRLQQP